MRSMVGRSTARRAERALFGLLLLLAASCTSLEFERDGAEHGTFRSSAQNFTIIGFDLPRPALGTARNNAADSALPNIVITDETVLPDLGPIDWILNIIGYRYAVVNGTWGYPPKE